MIAEVVLKGIKKIFIMGKPDIIQSDNRKEFDNKLMKEYLKKNKIKHILRSPYESTLSRLCWGI